MRENRTEAADVDGSYVDTIGAMGPLTPELFDLVIALISFLTVFAIFARVLLPRIEKVLKERDEAIDGTTARAADIEEEARRVRDQYRADLTAARQEAARLRQTAAEEGASLLAVLREEGQKEREKVVASARTQLEADRIIAEAELREATFALALELAGRIVGESVDDLPNARTIADDFFAELDEPEKSLRT
ncbi:F0F1 ATP synthase subunit B family protein [Streptomyces uncialis]|uniref:F0F1 ATP synthase subunit B family protein n=1 Tax=Streptomyces uncialis TaxID=1048205 RepID=UPI003796CCD0